MSPTLVNRSRSRLKISPFWFVNGASMGTATCSGKFPLSTSAENSRFESAMEVRQYRCPAIPRNGEDNGVRPICCTETDSVECSASCPSKPGYACSRRRDREPTSGAIGEPTQHALHFSDGLSQRGEDPRRVPG